MKLVGVGQAQAGLSGLLDQSQKERIILTRHGVPVAMLMGVEGRDLEELVLSQDFAFRDLIEERRRDKRANLPLTTLLSEAKRELATGRPALLRRRTAKK